MDIAQGTKEAHWSQSQQTGTGLEKASEISEDTEGSENDHFLKVTLVASQAQRVGEGGGGEAAFIPTQLKAVHFSLEKKTDRRVFSAAVW